MPSFGLDAVKRSLASRDVAREPRAASQAAVAVVLRETSAAVGPELLLIRRAHRDGDPWSGHVAFPGGRRHESDASLVATAVRETHEEVGVDLASGAELIGGLDEMPAMSRGLRVGLVVAPYVFGVRGDGMPLRLDPREVEDAMWVPIEPYFRGERATTIAYDHEGTRLVLPAYEAGGHVVWGMTYKMIASFFEVLRSGPDFR